MPRNSKAWLPAALLIATAAAAAYAHRAWIQADPCTRMSEDQLTGHPRLEALAYRHDQQREALMAAHDLGRAAALMTASPVQRIEITSSQATSKADRLVELAQRQRIEFTTACRSIVR